MWNMHLTWVFGQQYSKKERKKYQQKGLMTETIADIIFIVQGILRACCKDTRVTTGGLAAVKDSLCKRIYALLDSGEISTVPARRSVLHFGLLGGWYFILYSHGRIVFTPFFSSWTSDALWEVVFCFLSVPCRWRYLAPSFATIYDMVTVRKQAL